MQSLECSTAACSCLQKPVGGFDGRNLAFSTEIWLLIYKHHVSCVHAFQIDKTVTKIDHHACFHISCALGAARSLLDFTEFLNV